MANTQQQPLLIGPAVGQAQAVLNRLLAGILAESGTSRRDYLALQRLTVLGGQASRDAYERDLSRWLELDGPAARQLADGLLSAGLVSDEADGTVRLGAPGRALREQVLAASAKTTGPVLAAIDPEDLETTVRTLDQITKRLATEVDR